MRSFDAEMLDEWATCAFADTGGGCRYCHGERPNAHEFARALLDAKHEIVALRETAQRLLDKQHAEATSIIDATHRDGRYAAKQEHAYAERCAKLEGELAKWRAEGHRLFPTGPGGPDVIQHASDRLAEVEKERAALLLALKPFAEFPDAPSLPDNTILTPFAWAGDETFEKAAPGYVEDEATLSLGDLRRARKAFNGK